MMMKTKQPNKSRGKITLAVVVYVEEEMKNKKKKRNVGVKSSFASSSREVDKSDDCFVSSSVSSSAKKETLSSESSKLLLLENVSIAIKDNIDVKGLKTGCGNPDFLRDFSPKAKTENAPLVEHLLREGGHVIGKTHMDELAWSLQGENYHYGTPRNGRALGRIPGGSSSGSASAVSQKLVDLAVGTDTAGSVRVPASFCGVYSIRMTHNFDERMCHEGIVPLAKSFDVPGFFANDLKMLLRATKAVFLKAFPDDTNNSDEEESSNTNSDDDRIIEDVVKFVKLEDAFALATDEARGAIDTYLEKNGIEYETVKLKENQNILEWWDDFRVQQTDDVWKAHGEWIRKRNPKFGPGVHERFYGAEEVSEDTKNVERAREMNRKRAEIIRNEVFRRRKSKTICIVPAAACAPPKLDEDASVVNDLRVKTLSLSSISGLTGLPEVVVPCVSNKNELPIGVGFIGWERKCDVALLQTLLEKRL